VDCLYRFDGSANLGLPSVTRRIEVESSKQRVWQVVSDVDNEPEYWHGTKEVRNISKQGNVIRREILQNFMSTKIIQQVTLNPQDSVEVEYLEGTTVGRKSVRIESLGEDRQMVEVTWQVRFTGILRLATPIIRSHIVKGTENALARIKQVAEEERTGTPEPETSA
jgi:ribosome-associated toxin RatA of RatAB toxin-antitoxin module